MRANTGKPPVRFPAVLGRAGYELHGTKARDYYRAQQTALEWVRGRLAELGIKSQRGDEPR